ncbi:MAG: peptidase M50, partial [Pseudomonadota bacterium]|nr:peptidase M50 [Pseudomonadota bacterium]
MSVTVFSKNWYRVEFLKPRLKVQVDVASQVHRGDRWFVLRDTISGNVQRYSWQAYQLIGLMDGDHSLHELWEQSADTLEQDMPTQDEVISLVAGLYQADMIHLNVTPNVRDLFQRQQSKADKKLLSRVQSPLSIQLPLLDPTAILDRLCPYLDRLLTWKMALFYLVVVIWAAVVGLQHFDALTSNLSD